MPLSKDIKADYGATGDAEVVTATVSITSGDATLTSSTSIWVLGDVGKHICVPGAGPDDALPLITTIASFTSATSIELTDTASRTLSSVSQMLCWGTNDSAAFKSFNDEARLASGLVELAIPAGGYFFGTDDSAYKNWCRGIPLLKVTGTGSPTLAGHYQLGAFTYFHNGGPEVTGRTASASAGATTLQLLTVADAEKFVPGYEQVQSDGVVHSTGAWLRMSALDMQSFGDPNQFYTEFVQVSGVDEGTGVITLSTPLVNSYLSTFPEYNSGDAFHPDCGGPATAYALDDSWDCNIEHIGMTYYHPGTQTNHTGRTIKFTSCTWLSPVGPNPSVNETLTYDDCDMSACFVEADKSVKNLYIQNGTEIDTLEFQSASIDNLTCSNSTLTLQGTPKNTTLTNCTIPSLRIGPTGYGRANSVTATNCDIAAISAIGATETDIIVNPGDANNDPYTISGGVISQAVGPARWAIPGTFVMFQGTKESETGFTVNSLSDVGGVTKIGTSLSGGFPNVPLQGGTRLDVMAHPAPTCTFSGCTGSADAVDLSNSGAQGRPIYQYSKRTYSLANSNLTNPISGPHIWGRIRSIRVNVSVAFTTASRSLELFGQFLAEALNADDTANVTWGPSVDLNTSGIRTYTAGVGWSGTAGADDLTDPGAIWFAGQQSPFVSGAITGGDPGSVEIEVVTSQGLADAVAATGSRRHKYVAFQM